MLKYLTTNLKNLLLAYFCVSFCALPAYTKNPPKLTVVIIVDQCAYQYFNKIHPHLKHGLKYLLDNGIQYTNAHVPHGKTGPSHTSLNTGTYAKNHGIVGNKWINNEGKRITCDHDTPENSAVFNPREKSTFYSYGKSPRNIMVDGITDQFVLQSSPQSLHHSYSFSGKSRSAIATAGRMGKAYWIDSPTGLFTSSKYYVDQLPDWVTSFNTQHDPHKNEYFVWNKMYPKSPFAYNFFNTQNYSFSKVKDTLIGIPLPVQDPLQPTKPHHFFEQSPLANNYILEMSKKCITTHVNRKTKDRLLLWVCLSPLDKLVHEFGPDSMEALDMLYHLDRQLKLFIRHAYKAVGKHNVMITLTADHGIMPIAEVLQSKGFDLARRITHKDFVAQLNDMLFKDYSIKNAVTDCMGYEIVLNKTLETDYPQIKNQEIINSIKKSTASDDWVKNVWESKDLLLMNPEKNSTEYDVKNQLFPGRSGDVVLQPYPYTILFNSAKGTGHKSTYNYDTHVPLILFYPGRCEKKYIRERVSTTQLANTLAELLNVPKPSTSTANVLPELFDPEYQ